MFVSERYDIFRTVVIYYRILFILGFIFQNKKYKYKQAINWSICLVGLLFMLGKFLREDLFYELLGLEIFIVGGILVFLMIIFRKRIYYILKYSFKPLMMSSLIIVSAFVIYINFYKNQTNMLINVGSYMFNLLYFTSIHIIIFNNSRINKQKIEFISGFILILFAIGLVTINVRALSLSMIEVYILLHSIYLMVGVYNIILYLKVKKVDLPNKIRKENFYSYSLEIIKKEEKLKYEISNFLHDNILQDVFALKMLANEVDILPVKNRMLNILEGLNQNIRTEVEVYYPTILKSLTLKENYQNLIDTLNNQISMSDIDIIFYCEDDIFIIEPYHIVIYRMMKELITNAFKHSKAKIIEIVLEIKNDNICLEVKDNGIGFEYNNDIQSFNNGMKSVWDTVLNLDGKMIIDASVGKGTNVSIVIPMKGEISYESFVNRRP